MFCDQDFGQEKPFVIHLENIHGILQGEEQMTLYMKLNDVEIRPTCQCSPECDKQIAWLGWKKGFSGSRYARGHNAVIDTCFRTKAKEFAKKREEGYRSGKYKVWNDGLTKETSEKIVEMAEKTSITLQQGYETGRIVAWQILEPERAIIVGEKISETKKENFASGKTVTWIKGLTKETDPRVALLSQSVLKYFETHDCWKKLKEEDFYVIANQHNDKFELLSTYDDYVMWQVARLQFRCRTCNQVQEKSLVMYAGTPICFNCYPKSSQAQLEIYDYVKSLIQDEVLLNDRTLISPKEVDIYVPSHKFAIEYNGLYWHSEACIKDIDYHQKKHVACEEKGVSLLFVFQDEWRDKRKIIETMIAHRLGVFEEKLDARKLRVVKKKNDVAFFDQNHLDGGVRAKTMFCLVDNTNRVVATMSLRSPIYNDKKYSEYFEIARATCLSNVNVRGWLGKLTKACHDFATSEGKKGLITYVDQRVGSGKSYEKAGWKMLKFSTGNRFWWTNDWERFDRGKCKADKTRGMTEKEVALERKLHRIYGCTNSLFVYEKV